MPPRSRNPETGQPALPGLERRPTLAHLLAPEAAGINLANYTDITVEMLADASPDLLQTSLVNVDPDGRSVVWYKPHPRGSPVYLAVNPEDYNHIARNIPKLSKAVVNKTLETYPIEVRFDADNQARAERSGVHAVKVKLPYINQRLEELSRQRELLETVHEMTEPDNLNMRRSYVARSQFHELMSDAIGTMVNAVGNHRKYTTNPMQLMRKSMEARLYLKPESVSDRQDYMRQLTDLGITYYGHLVIMYATRRYEATKFIRDNS